MIRAALATDVPAILALIRELAAYEKLTAACIATEALLREHLFGPVPAAEVLVAEIDARLVGYALFFRTFSTFLARPGIYLEDLYVQPEHRGNGLGTAMLRHLAAFAIQRGYGRVEWSVLNWNTPSIGFYQSLGAEPMEGWTMYRLAGPALTSFAQGNDD